MGECKVRPLSHPYTEKEVNKIYNEKRYIIDTSNLITINNKINWSKSILEYRKIYYTDLDNKKTYIITLLRKSEKKKSVIIEFNGLEFSIQQQSLLNGWVYRIINHEKLYLKELHKNKTNNVYSVYCHVNKINDKIYIGITSTFPSDRWGCGGKGYRDQMFGRAIRKYGWHNFKHIILLNNLSKDEAEIYEIELIKKYKTTDPNYGYNIKYGGNVNQTFPDSVREKISKSHKGRKLTKEWIENRSVSQTGLKRTQKTKDKIRNAVSVPVVCINNRKVYSSLTAASKSTNAMIGHISQCCNKKRTSAGTDAGVPLFWMFYSEYILNEYDDLPNEDIIQPRKNVGRKGVSVRNKKTNTIYKSISSASKNTGINSDKIVGDARTKKEEWEYVTDTKDVVYD